MQCNLCNLDILFRRGIFAGLEKAQGQLLNTMIPPRSSTDKQVADWNSRPFSSENTLSPAFPVESIYTFTSSPYVSIFALKKREKINSILFLLAWHITSAHFQTPPSKSIAFMALQKQDHRAEYFQTSLRKE